MILTDEKKSIKEAARRFSHERLLPTYRQRELDGHLDRSLIREIGRLGFIGVDLPVKLGGLGLDGVTSGLIIEELGYGDFNIASTVVVAALLSAIIARDAKPEIAQHWVPAIVRGDAIVALADEANP